MSVEKMVIYLAGHPQDGPQVAATHFARPQVISCQQND
jgi:hypothetical protein